MNLAIKVLFSLTLTALTGRVFATTMSGEVVSEGTQNVFAPQSNSVPVPLVKFVSDGSVVRRGDIVVSTDFSLAVAETTRLKEDAKLATTRWQRDVAELRIKDVEAKIAAAKADSDYKIAVVNGALPKELVSSLDYERFQSELRRATVALAAAARAERNAGDAVIRARLEADAEAAVLAAKIARSSVREGMGQVMARINGTMVHSYGVSRAGGKVYSEGGTALPGAEIGKIVPSGDRFSVRLWPLASEAARLRIGQEIRFILDAKPGAVWRGSVTFVSQAAVLRPDWGSASYVEVVISVPDAAQHWMLPGMRVTAEDDPSDVWLVRLGEPLSSHEPIRLYGRAYAPQSVAVTTPSASELGRLTIANIVADGVHVSAGETIATLDTSTIDNLIDEARHEVSEATQSLRSIEVEAEDKEKEIQLEVADAAAAAEKARLKAVVPVKYTPGIQVKKLILEREAAKAVSELVSEKARFARALATAKIEMERTRVHIARNRQEELDTLRAHFNLKSTISGTFFRQDGSDGRKLDSGAVIYAGQSVGSVAPGYPLAVHVSVPERQVLKLQAGQEVRVRFLSNGQVVDGRIAHVGRTVHIDQDTPLIPVVSAEVILNSQPSQAEIGAPVEVEVPGGAT